MAYDLTIPPKVGGRVKPTFRRY